MGDLRAVVDPCGVIADSPDAADAFGKFRRETEAAPSVPSRGGASSVA